MGDGASCLWRRFGVRELPSEPLMLHEVVSEILKVASALGNWTPADRETRCFCYQLLTWIVTVAEAGGSGGGVFGGLVTRSVTVSVPVLAFAE
jgi:hypothetical protein